MATDPKDLMLAALLTTPNPDVVDENQDFQAGRRWNDQYPYYKEENFEQPGHYLTPQAMFATPTDKLMQLAGDVVPLYPPGTAPAAAGGRSMDATAYGWGTKTAPNIYSIGTQTMMDWLNRTATRNR